MLNVLPMSSLHPRQPSPDELWDATTLSCDWSERQEGELLLRANDTRWLQNFLRLNDCLRQLSQSTKAPSLLLDEQFKLLTDGRYRLRHNSLLQELLHGLRLLREVASHCELQSPYTPQDEPTPEDTRPALRLSPYMTAFLEAFPPEKTETLPSALSKTLCHAEIVSLLQEVNPRVQQFHARTKDATFRKRLETVQRAANKNRQSLLRLIEQLFVQYARLLVIRVDFSYSLRYKPKITHARIEQDREAFLRQRRSHPLFKSLAAYAWKLEYGLEKGLHLHLLFFFDGAKVREDITLAQQLGQLWLETTQGQGLVYNSNLTACKQFADSPDNALGMVSHDDRTKLKALSGKVVTYLTKLDEYVALCVPKGKRTFGHSQVALPREGQARRGRPRKHPSVVIRALQASAADPGSVVPPGN